MLKRQQRLQLSLEDVATHDAIMRTVCRAIIGRMTDGIFALRQHIGNEVPVVIVIWKTEPHLINLSDNLFPFCLPYLYRRTNGIVGMLDIILYCRSSSQNSNSVCIDANTVVNLEFPSLPATVALAGTTSLCG